MFRRTFAIALLTAVFCCAISVSKADEPSAEAQALSTCKSFGSAATAYSARNPLMAYWGSGTTDFGPGFSHAASKNGYTYRYFSNSSAPVKNDATRFVYMAFPDGISSGKKAFYIDETLTVSEAALTTDEQCRGLKDAKVEVARWKCDDDERIQVPGVVFRNPHWGVVRASAAHAICKSFGVAALRSCAMGETADYWGGGTTDFKPHFSHAPTKGSYVFSYYSNSSTPSKSDATKFVYLATPSNSAVVPSAFFIDESQCIFEAAIGNEEQCRALLDLKPAGIKWALDDNKRLDVPGVVFGNADRRDCGEDAALMTCKLFGVGAVVFSQTRETQTFWGSDTADFKPHFFIASPRFGYTFVYSSNSSAPDVHDATKYIYLAAPSDKERGAEAFYLDETMTIYKAPLSFEGQYRALKEFKPWRIDWDIDGSKRLDVPAVSFVQL